MTPAQVTAARGLLRWSRQKLAGRSGTTYHLVTVYECSGRIARTHVQAPWVNPVLAIRAALVEAGIEFTDGDAPWVRLREPAG